jgi:hypothetical protein
MIDFAYGWPVSMVHFGQLYFTVLIIYDSNLRSLYFTGHMIDWKFKTGSPFNKPLHLSGSRWIVNGLVFPFTIRFNSIWNEPWIVQDNTIDQTNIYLNQISILHCRFPSHQQSSLLINVFVDVTCSSSIAKSEFTL